MEEEGEATHLTCLSSRSDLEDQVDLRESVAESEWMGKIQLGILEQHRPSCSQRSEPAQQQQTLRVLLEAEVRTSGALPWPASQGPWLCPVLLGPACQKGDGLGWRGLGSSQLSRGTFVAHQDPGIEI